jgi:hypothetical protein
MKENTEPGHELRKIGLTEIDIEALTKHRHLYSIIRIHLAAACPDNWGDTDVFTGYGTSAATAEAAAVTIAELVGGLMAGDAEKRYNCPQFNCPNKSAACVFDWGLIGKPTPAVELPTTTTKKHNIEVKGKWESSQKIGFGCFCFRDA